MGFPRVGLKRPIIQSFIRAMIPRQAEALQGCWKAVIAAKSNTLTNATTNMATKVKR